MIYDIQHEFSNRRCFIRGSFAELPIDKEVVVQDAVGVLYSGVVVTRCEGGVIVRVNEVLVD